MKRPEGCAGRRAELFLWLDGELDLESALDFERHLSICRHCRRAADEHRRVEHLLGRALQVSPDPTFEVRLRRRLEQAFAAGSPDLRAGSAVPRRGALERRSLVASLAASFLLAGGALLLSRSGAPTSAERLAPPSPPPLVERTRARDNAAVRFVLAPAERERARFFHEEVARAVREAAVSEDPSASFARARRRLEEQGAVVEVLLRRLVTGADGPTARAAARVAAAAGVRSTVPALRRASLRRDRADEALRALGRLGAGLAELRHALHDGAAPLEVRRAALDGLTSYGGERAARVVAELLAATTSPPLGSPALGASELAEALLHMGDAGQRELARLSDRPEVLRLLDDASLPAGDQLVRWLADADSRVRARAIARAPSAGSSAVAPLALLAVGEGPEGEQARGALARIGGLEAWRALVRLLSERTIDVGDLAPHLAHLVATNPPDPTTLLDSLEPDEVLAALGCLRGRPEAAAWLRRVLEERRCSAAIRAEAAACLASVGRLDRAEALARFGEFAAVDTEAAARMVLLAATLGTPPRGEELRRLVPRLSSALAARVARLARETVREGERDPPSTVVEQLARRIARARGRI